MQAPKPLRFDLTALPVARDSFVFYLNGEERGQAVWQYEIQGESLDGAFRFELVTH